MFDPNIIIKTAGLVGIALAVFAESGLFFGFFLPGDTLLFAAGIFASQGVFSLSVLIIICAISAILGDTVGYWTGKKVGKAFFERETSLFFSKKRIYQAEHFYQKHGSATIILARFIPIIRTFAPIVAGVAKMHYKTFALYNTIGGILWAVLIPTLGYYFGGLIPNIDQYIMIILFLVIGFSFLPFVIKLIHHFLKK
jgi:membrane-associated protein